MRASIVTAVRFTFERPLIKIHAFMKSDVFWSLFAMPIGLVLCFGPAIVVWLLAGTEDAPDTVPAKPTVKP
jgi:hypothetical protein